MARWKSKRWLFRSLPRYEVPHGHVASYGKPRPTVAATGAMKRLIVASWRWVDDRLGVSALIGPRLEHLVPPDARWGDVFGRPNLLAFILQVVNCVALAFS